MSTSPILTYTTLIKFSHRMALFQQQAGKDKLALRWLDFEAEARRHSNKSGKLKRLDDNWTCDADIQDIVQELAPVPDRVFAPNRSLDEVFKKFGEEAQHAGWTRNDALWLDEERNVVRKCLEALVTPPFVNGDESLPAPTPRTALFQLIDFIEGDASDFHRFGAFECRVILEGDGPKLHRGFCAAYLSDNAFRDYRGVSKKEYANLESRAGTVRILMELLLLQAFPGEFNSKEADQSVLHAFVANGSKEQKKEVYQVVGLMAAALHQAPDYQTWLNQGYNTRYLTDLREAVREVIRTV